MFSRFRRPIKIVVISALIILSCWILYHLALVVGFAFLMNKNSMELVETIPSPNEEYVAYISTIDLGATSRTTYYLSVYPRSKEFVLSEQSSVYVSDSEFAIIWQDDRTLVVNNNPVYFEDDIIVQESSVEEIAIHYTRR